MSTTLAELQQAVSNIVAEQGTGWDLEEAHGRPLNEVFRIVDEKTLQSTLVREELLSSERELVLRYSWEGWYRTDMVEFREAESSVKAIVGKLESLGYPATPFDAAAVDEFRADRAGRDLLARLGVESGLQTRQVHQAPSREDPQRRSRSTEERAVMIEVGFEGGGDLQEIRRSRRTARDQPLWLVRTVANHTVAAP